MPLNQGALRAALENVFNSDPASPAAAANALAQAYDDYASAGVFGSSIPTLTGKKAALASTLAGGLVVPGSAAALAGAWASGIAAYWTAVPVAGAQAGTTVGCPGAASLSGTLTTTFSNIGNTETSCATSLAGALHAATQTVTATVSPPPGTVVPIA
jgi:hypothetical protein